MYELFIKTMDCIPVSGLVGEQLFCCHGGIPVSENKIKNLMKMPVSLRDPAEDYQPAFQILWSDPSETADIIEIGMTMGSGNTENDLGSYIPNVKRGAGTYFDERAMRTFNQVNGTSHLLRAHEQQKFGFKLNFGGTVVTVFSSSQYERLNNIAAVLLVTDETITPCQVQT